MRRVTRSKIHFQRASQIARLQSSGSNGKLIPSPPLLVESLNTLPKQHLFIAALSCIVNSIEQDSSPQCWETNRRLLEHMEYIASRRFESVWYFCGMDEGVMDAAHMIANIQCDCGRLKDIL